MQNKYAIQIFINVCYLSDGDVPDIFWYERDL